MSLASASFQVPRMSRGSCRSQIENALTPLAGVRRATVDLRHRRVAVNYDPSAIGLVQLVEAIENAGYPVAAAAKRVA